MNRDGFLSPDIEPLAVEAWRDYCPAHVALVARVNQSAIALLVVPRDIQLRDADLFAVTLFGRAVQDFEGAVLLAVRGLRAQSRSMARSTFETALYCVAASRDLVLSQGAKKKPKKDEAATTRFIEAFEGGHQRYRSHMATELRVMEGLPNEKVPELDAVLDEIGTPGQHQDIDLYGLALDLKLADLYTIVYRSLSQDAHPSATSLQHQVESTDSGQITGLRIGPDYEQLADTLALAACSLLVAMEGFADRFGTAEELDAVKALVRAYRELHEGHDGAVGPS